MKKFTIRNILRVALFVTVLFCINNSIAQPVVTLHEAIDSALVNNIEVRQALINSKLGEEDLKLSKSSLLPTVNGNAYGYKVYGNLINSENGATQRTAVNIAQGNLYADVTLYNGFEKTNTIKQNKYFLDADNSNLQKVKNDLVLNVLATYLHALTNRDLLAAAKQQLDVAKQELDKEQKFYQVKQKTLADLSQAKAQVANAELNVTNSQNEMELAYLTLAQLMERSPAKPFVVVSPLKDDTQKLNTAYTSADVYAQALKDFPDIQMLTNQRLGYETAIAVAKGQLQPTLSLAANLNSSYSGAESTNSTQIIGNQTIGYLGATGTPIIAPTYAYHDISFGNQLSQNFNQSVGVVLSIPIFDGYIGRTAVRKAKLTYENAEASEQLAKKNLSKVIDEAVWDVQATEKKYQASMLSFKSADDAFKIMMQRYSVGLVTSQDVSLAETDRNAAEFSLIQVKYDLIYKNKLIDYYLGKQLSL